MSSSPGVTEDPPSRVSVKFVETQSPPVGVLLKFGEEVSLSFENGSKLRDPSPIAQHTSHPKVTRGLLVTNLLLLNYGQETRTISELAPLSSNFRTTPQREPLEQGWAYFSMVRATSNLFKVLWSTKWRRCGEYQLTMSSAVYSSSPVYCSRGSPSILAWPQSGQASLAVMPSEWSGQSLPWLSKTLHFLGHGSIFVNVCGDNALCSSEGQGDFRLSRQGSLLVFLVGSFIAGDLNMTLDPLTGEKLESEFVPSPAYEYTPSGSLRTKKFSSSRVKNCSHEQTITFAFNRRPCFYLFHEKNSRGMDKEDAKEGGKWNRMTRIVSWRFLVLEFIT
ncbi:hypothetical protein TNCV_488771 [Trichonephila clavipes]|nr:hypothetical protein TNCV_488771 [Trichonephila clavipes]